MTDTTQFQDLLWVGTAHERGGPLASTTELSPRNRNRPTQTQLSLDKEVEAIPCINSHFFFSSIYLFLFYVYFCFMNVLSVCMNVLRTEPRPPPEPAALSTSRSSFQSRANRSVNRADTEKQNSNSLSKAEWSSEENWKEEETQKQGGSNVDLTPFIPSGTGNLHSYPGLVKSWSWRKAATLTLLSQRNP